ncbi:MAG TPA: glycosyltransferase [Bacteroidales bacterium]|nr:glycosyltransferase [Bacteroidales bacterium]HOX76506.1 glycosyltransferase [Bacteroidales bacterium]HPM92171.1 glycosyltransferase [Bacteroidales bacterium]
MKKVLVILYYWPPAGGSAVQRWLRFCKYLPEYGWEPTVVAPENAFYTDLDKELVAEIPEKLNVLKIPIREPHRIYKAFVGLKKEENIGAYMSMKTEPKGFARIKNDLSVWIRSNFFVPDARIFWIRPVTRFLKKYLASHTFDAIVTTGPPHSIHLIGLKLKASTTIPWVADFRDPWTSTDLHSALKLTRYAEKKHIRLESKVIRAADHIIAIGNDMKNEFLKIGAENITVITNGYDESDIRAEYTERDRKFSIVHLGTLPATRNSSALWKVLSEKVVTDKQFAKDLSIHLIGTVDYKVVQEIEALNIKDYLSITQFVKHNEGMEILRRSAVLLLLINRSKNARGVVTGKIFEYMAVRRPVLLIGPVDGDAAAIIRETECGLCAEFDDEQMIRTLIDHYYNLFQKNELEARPGKVSQYSRKSLAATLAQLLDKLQGDISNQVN